MITSIKRIQKIKRMRDQGQSIKNICALEGLDQAEVERVLALPTPKAAETSPVARPMRQPDPEITVSHKGVQWVNATLTHNGVTVPVEILEISRGPVSVGPQTQEATSSTLTPDQLRVLLVTARKSRSIMGLAAELKMSALKVMNAIQVLLLQKLVIEDTNGHLKTDIYRATLKGVLALRERGHKV